MRKFLKKQITKISHSIPLKIRFVSLSIFLFMIWWWLGTNTYFSLFVKEIIWNSWWVTLVWTILALSKLALVIPVWRMNDHANIKYLLLIWKILYVLCGIGFFLAGIFHSRELLIIATILHGFASATTFTSYRSYYGKNSNKKNNAQVFWAYFSSSNVAEIFGALIAAFLVQFLDLSYMYFFVVIFALVSLLQDQKIKTVLSKRYNRTWKNFYKRVKLESKYEDEIDEWRDSDKKFLWKKWFLKEFVQECCSLDSWKNICLILKKYNLNMYVALGSQFLTNLLNYISFLFVPIIAIENNLSLSQIAIVYAVMKVPYIINIFMWKFWDKYNKKLLISWILLCLSFMYVAMWYSEGFYTILWLTFLISMWIAMLNPLTSALVSSYVMQKDKWSMSWVQDFISRLWEMTWSIWFGSLTARLWLKVWFVIVWFCLFWLSWYLLFKKIISYNWINNERENSNEFHEIPVPVVDVYDIKSDLY